MKLLMMIVLTALSTSTVQAHDQELTTYSSEVGVQAIARAVVDKNLVDEEARETLLLALETGRATLGKMECDRATGKDICAIEVMILDDETTEEAEETLYRLDVHVYQGTATSAVWTLIAG